MNPSGMSTERFNELLQGPLNHPLVPFAISRLAQALFHVVTATGGAGAAALEDWCRGRDDLDADAGGDVEDLDAFDCEKGGDL